jgi:hypothetical protein
MSQRTYLCRSGHDAHTQTFGYDAASRSSTFSQNGSSNPQNMESRTYDLLSRWQTQTLSAS